MHPVPQRVPAGHRIELLSEAEFDPALTWSWLKDGRPVPGADNNRLILRNAQPADEGLYRAVAHSVDSEAWSREVPVSVIYRSPSPGAVDLSFRDRFMNGSAVFALLPLPDGSVIIGGDFTGVGPRAIGRVTRLLPDGAPDGDFNAAGFGADGPVRALAADDDGRCFLGGSFSTYNGLAVRRLIRLGADGTADASYVAALDPAATEVRALARQPDGKLLAAGTSVNGSVTTHWVVRLLDDGSLDPAFAMPAFLNGKVNCLTLQTDGRILLGGNFRQNPPGTAGQFNRVARLQPNGFPDSSFAPPGGANAGANAEVRALAVQSDGRIVMGGKFTSVNGTARFGLARLTPIGALDAAFNPAPDDFVSAVWPESAGTLLVGGLFTRIGGATLRSLARLQADGTAAETFTPPGFNDEVVALTTDQNGRLLAAGNFTQPHSLVVRLHTTAFYTAPIVVRGPSDVTLSSNIPAILTAAFDAYPIPVIQWFRDGMALAAATGPEFAASIPGTYFARASNTFGTTDSPPAVVGFEIASAGARPARTFVWPTPPQAMADSGTFTATLPVGPDVVIDEARLTLHVTHPDVSQLAAELVSPAGTIIALVNNPGRRGADFDKMVLADAASVRVRDGTAPFVGSFQPEGQLSRLQGEGTSGLWVLRITDTREDLLAGTFLRASLDIFSPAPPPTYSGWTHHYLGSESTAAGPFEDANGDGNANLLCFAFATSPNQLPETTWITNPAAIFHRRWAVPAGVSLSYEFSSDCDTWSPAAPMEIFRRRLDDQSEDVMIAFPAIPIASACYFRVQAR
jgi:uncharacterized delta-60 repeat protein